MINVLSFLRELKENNNREWFQSNKKRYDSIKVQLEKLTLELIAETGAFDKDILLINPKDCMFRIYRDVRFSHDKSPYKTNIGIALSKGGKKGNFAGYYFHIEPGASFVGGGIWMPQPDVLNAIRKEIFYNAAEFKKIINNSKFKKELGELDGEKLVKPPKNFPADFEDIDLLKFKSYICGKSLSDKDLESDNLVEQITVAFKALHPLNVFLNSAITENI